MIYWTYADIRCEPFFLFVENSYKLHNKQNTVQNYERAN